MEEIPAKADIKSAILSIYRYSDYLGYDYPSSLSMYSISEEWDEQSATWDNLALSTGELLSQQEMPSKTVGYLEFDITPYIQKVVNNEIPNNGTMLACTTSNQSNSNGQFSFLWSSESTEGPVPKLTVEYDETSVLSLNGTSSQLFSVQVVNDGIVLDLPKGIKAHSIRLFSIQGQQLYEERFGGVTPGQVYVKQNLAPGCYVVHVKTEQHDMRKLIHYK